MLENERFMQEHPDVPVAVLAGSFHLCQKRRGKDLEETYRHAFGDAGREGCARCRQAVEEHMRLSRWAT